MLFPFWESYFSISPIGAPLNWNWRVRVIEKTVKIINISIYETSFLVFCFSKSCAEFGQSLKWSWRSMKLVFFIAYFEIDLKNLKMRRNFLSISSISEVNFSISTDRLRYQTSISIYSVTMPSDCFGSWSSVQRSSPRGWVGVWRVRKKRDENDEILNKHRVPRRAEERDRENVQLKNLNWKIFNLSPIADDLLFPNRTNERLIWKRFNGSSSYSSSMNR